MKNLLLPAAIVFVALIGQVQAETAAAQQPEIKILNVQRRSASSYSLLFQVDNPSDTKFKYTNWSCVFFNGETPVYEERSSIEFVPARGHAIKRDIMFYGGPFTSIECRFLDAW